MELGDSKKKGLDRTRGDLWRGAKGKKRIGLYMGYEKRPRGELKGILKRRGFNRAHPWWVAVTTVSIQGG